MSKANLTQILIQLFGDPALYDKFRSNGWKDLGLDDSEIDMLERRDGAALKQYLQEEGAKLVLIAHWLPKKEE